MCWRGVAVFACGHESITPGGDCSENPDQDAIFPLRFACPAFTSRVLRVQYACGLGKFYCAHSDEGVVSDDAFRAHETTAREIAQLSSQIASIEAQLEAREVELRAIGVRTKYSYHPGGNDPVTMHLKNQGKALWQERNHTLRRNRAAHERLEQHRQALLRRSPLKAQKPPSYADPNLARAMLRHTATMPLPHIAQPLQDDGACVLVPSSVSRLHPPRQPLLRPQQERIQNPAVTRLHKIVDRIFTDDEEASLSVVRRSDRTRDKKVNYAGTSSERSRSRSPIRSEVESTFSLPKSNASDASTTILHDSPTEILEEDNSPLARRAQRGLQGDSPLASRISEWRRRDAASSNLMQRSDSLLSTSVGANPAELDDAESEDNMQRREDREVQNSPAKTTASQTHKLDKNYTRLRRSFDAAPILRSAPSGSPNRDNAVTPQRKASSLRKRSLEVVLKMPPAKRPRASPPSVEVTAPGELRTSPAHVTNRDGEGLEAGESLDHACHDDDQADSKTIPRSSSTSPLSSIDWGLLDDNKNSGIP